MPDTELKLHVATLRCFIFAKDEVEAVLAAEEIQRAAEELLEPEDGDEVEVTQVIPMRTDVEPLEIIHILIRARNALIRTRIRQCYDQARELDQTIHALRYREDEITPPYDYTELISVAQQILQDNKEPL